MSSTLSKSQPGILLKLAQTGLLFFVTTFPFQIRTIIQDDLVYASGHFNPYTTAFLHFGEIALSAALFCYALELIFSKKSRGFTVGHWLIAAALMVLSISIFQAIWPIFLYILIVNRVAKPKNILLWFTIGTAGQGMLAFLQYVLQFSLGLHILGEPFINQHIPGIAKINTGQIVTIRPYGTFPHPNVLGGAILIALIWLFTRTKQQFGILKKAKPALIILGTILLILTFSRSAILAFIISVAVYFFLQKNLKIIKKYLIIIIPIIVILATSPLLQERLQPSHSSAIQERFNYLQISQNMLVTNPLGIGTHQFTPIMQDFTEQKLSPWELQPVHNIFLLVANEQGILTGMLFLLFYYWLLKKISLQISKDSWALFTFLSLLSILIIGLFDHYFITLYPGQILFVLTLSITSIILQPQKIDAHNHAKSQQHS